nr:MAG TPA: PD-(D/E)XK nuclease superfamily protein [Caudoviricetes sp.]
MGKHALLSASSSHRWLNCPPSARLCEDYEDKGSEYAQEGTDAHSLCEHKLKLALGMESVDPTENLSFYNEEMEQCACDYAAYVLELVEEAKKICKDPVVLIEQRLDFSRFVAEGFGTGDCVIIADGTLYIVDYKHGKGVEVSAEENPQMMLYALGALELFDGIYDIDTVRMAIFQPRRENVSACIMSKDDLLQWAYNDLMAKAKLAYDGGGEFACGDWCRFCKAKAACRKRAEYNLELAKYDFAMPDTLEDAEIAAILEKADELASWAADVKEFALQQALGGVKYAGFKVVEGRSNRKYTNEDAVADTVKKAGYDPYEPKLLGITAMEKLLGKKQFAKLLSGLVEKPQGKPALVPESDKRQEMNIDKAASAAEDFKEN